MVDIDAKLNALGQRLETRFARGGRAGTFAKGFVTASLVFCVGPLTILGSIQDGLLGDYKLLAIKSILDGFAGLAFSASLGIGVGFAAITVLVFQGGIALLAMFVGSALGSVTRDTPWIVQLTATGGAPKPTFNAVSELKPASLAPAPQPITLPTTMAAVTIRAGTKKA